MCGRWLRSRRNFAPTAAVALAGSALFGGLAVAERGFPVLRERASAAIPA